MKRLIVSCLFMFFLSGFAAGQVFTFECICDTISGTDCDICNTTITGRSFNGLLILKNGTPFKWIDQPYTQKRTSSDAIIFLEQIPTPDQIQIALFQTQFATMGDFLDSTFCFCGMVDSAAVVTDTAYYQQWRENSVDLTQRVNANFINTSDIQFTLTDDPGAELETEVTAEIPVNAVQYSEIQQAAANTLIGNPTGGTADLQEITLGAGLSFSAGALTASGFLLDGGNTTGATVIAGTNDANALELETNGVSRVNITGGATTGGKITVTGVTANTNTIDDALILQTNSATSAATGFGSRILFRGESTAADNRDMAYMSAYWNQANDVNRTARIDFGLVQSAGAIGTVATLTGLNSGTLLLNGTQFFGTQIQPSANFTVGGTSGTITIGGSTGLNVISSSSTSSSAISISANLNTSTAVGGIEIGGGVTYAQTSNTRNYMNFGYNFSPTSGTAVHNSLVFGGTINQTGGANGIVRAVYDNRTLTAAADYRSFDIAVNSANAHGIYQSGTSTKNAFAGNTIIGATTTPAQTLHVAGTARITGSSGTATTIAGRDADGDISAVKLGSGLAFSNDTLTVTASGGDGIYGGDGTLPATGTDVTMGPESLRFYTNTSSGTTRDMIRLVTPYSSDDAFTNYISCIAPADSFKIYSFDNGTYLREAGGYLDIATTGNNDIYQSAGGKILVTADSVQVSDIDTTITLNGIVGLNSVNTLKQIQGTANWQILKWSSGKWRLGVDSTGSGGITSLNGLTGATQTFATGTSGTDFGISSASTTHTFNLPTASSSNRGALSTTDWSTFNGKIGGSGTSGQVAYFNGAGTITSNSGFVYNGTEAGIGIAASSAAALYVKQSSATSGIRLQQDGAGTAEMRMYISAGSWLENTAGNLSLKSAGQAYYYGVGGSSFIRQHEFIATSNITSVFNGSSVVDIGGTFAPTASGGSFQFLNLKTVVNQTGSADGIIRGIAIGPTLTAVTTGFYGIEYIPSTQHFLWQASGTGVQSHLIGNLGIGTGTTSPAAKIQVVGNGATSGTYGLIVTNSGAATATASLVVRDDSRVGVGTNAPGAGLDVQNSFMAGNSVQYSGDITPTTIGANQNDYSPTGWSTCSVARLSASAAYDITGLTNGTDGRIAYLVNVGSFNITLKNASGSSSAANRFAIAADIVIVPDGGVTLIYDSTSSLWRCVGKN